MNSGPASEELENFFATDYRRVLGAVTLVTGNRPAAEDAVHEALARAWERGARQGLDDIRELDKWILTVALNFARSRWRKLRREVLQRDVVTSELDPDTRISLDLRRTIARLPTRQREVIVLHYVLDLAVDDVADVLGLSSGGTKHALYRARNSLATALDVEEVAS